jgi:hypothetical protein
VPSRLALAGPFGFSSYPSETIATRGAVQKRTNKDRTQANLAKGIMEIKHEVKRLKEEAAKHDEIVMTGRFA